MFARLSSILSGDNDHVRKLYNEVTTRFAPVLPNDPHVMTMFFALQRAADRVYDANGKTPIIKANIKSIGYNEFLQLMDLHSGYMRRAAQLGFVNNFELLDVLAHHIFPETADNSLALFASPEGAMMLVPPALHGTWAGLTQGYLRLFMSICGSETVNQERAKELMSAAGQQQMQADIDIIVRGDPRGLAV